MVCLRQPAPRMPMIPEQYVGLYVTAQAAAFAFLAASLWTPRLARWMSAALFVWASVTNATTALRAPQLYLDYAPLALSDLYRDFITGWFAGHIQVFVLLIASGQLAIGVLLAAASPWRRLGAAGAVVFLLAITPLGIGSGFPFTIVVGAAIAIMEWKLARADRLLATPASGRRAIERYMPVADIRERHEVLVHAPADIVFDVAEHFDMMAIPSIAAVFRLRGLLLGSKPSGQTLPSGLVATTTALGWRPLERRMGRELIMGSATQPWCANVVFRPVPPDRFLAFAEPDLVKIAWTLEVDPVGAGVTRFRTETRALATDAGARRKFLRYWRWARLGIVLIRLLVVPHVRREAERRARLTPHGAASQHA